MEREDDYNSDERKTGVQTAGTPEGEEIELQAYSYVETEDGGEGNLEPIESDAEWDMIEEVLNTFMEDEDLQ